MAAIPLNPPLPTVEPTTPFDLDTDNDDNGMPDELEAAFAELNELHERAKTDPSAQPLWEEAQRRFESRLALQPRTREIRIEIQRIHLEAVKSGEPDAMAAATDRILALQAEMNVDPMLARVNAVLDAQFAKAWEAKLEQGKGARSTPLTGLQGTVNEPFVKGQDFVLFLSAILKRLNNPNELDPCSSDSAPSYGALLRGDIMLFSGNSKIANFLYAKKWTHAGIYEGVRNDFEQVYDANTNIGVRLNPMVSWQDDGTCVALGVTNNRSRAERENALNWAQETYGIDGRTPYNYNLIDKQTDDALYCSQLVWKAQQHIGVDVDSNDVAYRDWLVANYSELIGVWGTISAHAGAELAVAPDEIGVDDDISFFSEGTNQAPTR